MQSNETSETKETSQPSCLNKKRARTMFTPEQKEGLEKRYKLESHPDTLCQEQIAKDLGLTHSNVQNWFQNKRSKQRKITKLDEPIAAVNPPIKYSPTIIKQMQPLQQSPNRFNFSVHAAATAATPHRRVYPQFTPLMYPPLRYNQPSQSIPYNAAHTTIVPLPSPSPHQPLYICNRY